MPGLENIGTPEAMPREDIVENGKGDTTANCMEPEQGEPTLCVRSVFESEDPKQPLNALGGEDNLDPEIFLGPLSVISSGDDPGVFWSVFFSLLKHVLCHPGFMPLVEMCWSMPVECGGMLKLAEKLRRLKQRLKHWNKLVFGDVFQNIKTAEAAVLLTEGEYDASLSDDNLAAMDRRARGIGPMAN
ncbi:hypothetical protein Salat_1699600 [Sesamum alatum]|uniref:Uncharacterized protein n=1 Tax=Sesamum alatum TaxID=300844 RepID=A0AAE2CK19_9LAMI|nr:hypothetical protein Salat_1699600 [Sesamum alatum]